MDYLTAGGETGVRFETRARLYDPPMRKPVLRAVARMLAAAVPSLAVATIAVAFFQNVAGVANASAIYLVAVVVTAFVAGTWGGIVAAVASFLLYDFLFVLPLYTLTVADSGEWLNLVLLLFIGIVVGQLVALLRSRADLAVAREHAARDLFQISRALVTRPSTPAVLPLVADILRQESGMDRVWVALGADDAAERIAADTGTGTKPAGSGLYYVLQRTPDDTPARWSRVHQTSAKREAQPGGREAYRVRIEAAGRTLGSIWGLRDRETGEPDRTATRLLSAAADQVGQALAQDRLAAEAQAAEIARQSDALKSALLQSVSHDLRTPLATIRAAAGTLRPGSGLSEEDQRESADAIDREVEYLNRLVTNLLDLSRIEAGALRAERDVYELDDLVGRTIDRLRARLADRPLIVDLAAPPVDGRPRVPRRGRHQRRWRTRSSTRRRGRPDPRDRPAGARRARASGSPSRTRGPGVPDETLPLLFDKFYRVPGTVRRLPIRHRDRARRRAGPRRGDGRPGRRPPQRPRRPRDRHRPPDRGGHRAGSRPRPRDGDAARPAAGPTILVVEDDEETRAALGASCAPRLPDGRGRGRTRRRCVRWESRRPDLVLLDLGLPDMDGLRHRPPRSGARRRRRS